MVQPLNIFILTGAGISAESGLKTFRDSDGLWTQNDLAQLATPEGFARDPARVRDFYSARRKILEIAAPNLAHIALARLEREMTALGGWVFLCTQNVDDLHEKAGSRRVIHMHGELTRTRCTQCSGDWSDRKPLTADQVCPECGTIGATRPHVVWFGELPMHMAQINQALEEADLFVAIGTSGSVYPAAGFVAEARALGIPTCEINVARSDNAHAFDRRIYGPATEKVSQWVGEVLGD
ncbi:NAD-dependent deacylase [Caulobacter henricii]|uniref:NAD-dependent protein deacylase n=1 Tax=Caulobacter henricii TaxID=69395 RepID=A0A0N7JH01_9CAUL|nr:NAD-dependent deacylase [Caulobacter henricii]ALL12018.1 NAD-dependent deacetylase [Caulobacter henricii]